MPILPGLGRRENDSSSRVIACNIRSTYTRHPEFYSFSFRRRRRGGGVYRFLSPLLYNTFQDRHVRLIHFIPISRSINISWYRYRTTAVIKLYGLVCVTCPSTCPMATFTSSAFKLSSIFFLFVFFVLAGGYVRVAGTRNKRLLLLL